MTDPTAREILVNRLFAIPARVSAAVCVTMAIFGLLSGGVMGGVLIGFVVLILVFMLALMWADLSPVERLMRLSVAVFIACVGVVRVAISL